ncbi:MAG TPA: replication-associated recombination protein A [Firmicutes bacterium]|nr:replication-associated recombination protein A [Candidatus Fermentithermobacillaceae bacterium]
MGLFGKVEEDRRTAGNAGSKEAVEHPGRGQAGEEVSALLVIPPDAPLALRMTPRSFDEFVGQEDVVGPGKALRKAIEGDRIPSMLFWGPPGTGKTCLARLVAMKTKSVFRELSAVTSGVQDVRNVVAEARKNRERGKRTILFLDEIHRFNKAQQDALLPHVEKGTIALIGATTENPYFAVNPALLSRMQIFSFKHLEPRHIEEIVKRAVEDSERGLAAGGTGEAGPEGEAGERVQLGTGVLEHIVTFSKGDGRVALNLLEALYNVSKAQEGQDGKVVLTLERALEITQSPRLFYDKLGDQHYDIISAFIKSMRGSDPDATVYWLARMLESGEDPRFVARRIVICASEDVGLADPMALLVAEAAFRASEHIGMPEAQIPLAHAALYVALAPKSNSAWAALDAAIGAVREKPAYPVPPHLRGTGYSGAQKLGHGVGYKYAHNYPGHWVDQQYLPDELQGTTFYKKGEHDIENRGRPRT